MLTQRLLPAVCLLLLVRPSAAQRLSATELLAKARDAFQQNLKHEDHWNWTTTEQRVVLDKTGHPTQNLPDVTVESVIRKDGRRCNAVLTWGDGVPPYKLNEDADARCAGQEPTQPPFRMDALLASAAVKMGPRSPGAITLEIVPDRRHLHDLEHEVRCTASIHATLSLDPATYFPKHLEGKVVESGCEGFTSSELHYGEDPGPMPRLHRLLRKGTTFRLDYALQIDKFGNHENSYWLSAAQHWMRPFQQHANGIVYYNRLFKLPQNVPSPQLRLDSKTVAQEFGAVSEIHVDTGGKLP